MTGNDAAIDSATTHACTIRVRLVFIVISLVMTRNNATQHIGRDYKEVLAQVCQLYFPIMI
jgi:hypothetical protein